MIKVYIPLCNIQYHIFIFSPYFERGASCIASKYYTVKNSLVPVVAAPCETLNYSPFSREANTLFPLVSPEKKKKKSLTNHR